MGAKVQIIIKKTKNEQKSATKDLFKGEVKSEKYGVLRTGFILWDRWGVRQQRQQGELGLFFMILEFLCCLCCPCCPYAHLNQ